MSTSRESSFLARKVLDRLVAFQELFALMSEVSLRRPNISAGNIKYWGQTCRNWRGEIAVSIGAEFHSALGECRAAQQFPKSLEATSVT